MAAFRKVKQGWMGFVHVFGQVQTTVLLSVVYHLAIGPISMICRVMGRDLLMLRQTQGRTYAVDLQDLSTTPERAHKQF